MITAKLLIDTEDGQEYRIFYFDVNRVDGVYVVDSENMGVVISGADYILQFESAIFEEIQNTIKLRTLGLN
jgi:hypothetical protein